MRLNSFKNYSEELEDMDHEGAGAVSLPNLCLRDGRILSLFQAAFHPDRDRQIIDQGNLYQGTETATGNRISKFFGEAILHILIQRFGNRRASRFYEGGRCLFLTFP